MSDPRQVLILPGDGVGPEVMAQSRRVLDWFIRERGLNASVSEALYSVAAYERTGQLLPADTERAFMQADVVLFGAMGGPDYERIPAPIRHAGDLLKLRKLRELFINVRPIRPLLPLREASPLKARVLDAVDFIIIRELNGGIYFGEPRGIEPLAAGGYRGFDTQVYTSAEIRRIARYAFELARTRRGRVCSVDKANVMESGVLWRREVQALRAAEFPDIELEHMYADNCAMQIVAAPRRFDVIVTDNLFGDILSDCAAAVLGSLGTLPSASFGPVGSDGRRPALYEPVHGSAPDIAGKGLANPLAAILSLAMALRESFARPQDAALLERAVEAALAAGARTGDIREAGLPVIGCAEMGTAVLAQLAVLAGEAG